MTKNRSTGAPARRLAALAAALMIALAAGAFTAAAEDGLTVVTAFGRGRDDARTASFPDSAAFIWLTEQTRALGVELRLECAGPDDYRSAVSALLAGGDGAYDIMYLDIDASALSRLADRGALASVDAVLEHSDGAAADCLAPGGAFACLRGAGTGADGTFWALKGLESSPFRVGEWADAWAVGIRQDWLERLNLPRPDTADAFVDTLVAFRERDANGNGLPDETALLPADLSLGGAAGWFGLAGGPIAPDPVTGRMTAVFCQEGFGAYVEFIRKLAGAGVLADVGAAEDADALIARNSVGALSGPITGMAGRDALAGDAAADYRPVSPRGLAGATPTARGEGGVSLAGGYYALMDTIDIEAAAKLLDFFFSEDYWRWSRDGLEGNDYALDASGDLMDLTDGWTADEIIATGCGAGRFYMGRAVLPVPDLSAALFTFNGEPVGAFQSAAEAEASAYGQSLLGADDAADPTGRARALRLLSWRALEQEDAVLCRADAAERLALPTEAEAAVLDRYESGLDAAMNALFAELIGGGRSLDELDACLDELRAQGLDEVLSVYQARADRFHGIE